MSREVFERLHTPTWERFELLLDRLDRDDSEGAESFPTLYRQICFHLALVRSRLYGSDLEERLNLLARRGHEQLYAARPVLAKELLRLLAVEFPRLVRKEGKLVLAAMLLFYGPYFGMMIAVILSPDLIYTVLDPSSTEQYRDLYAPGTDWERPYESDVMMFGYYVWNNVGIALRTFATGLFFGLGSIFYLVYNGLVLGGVTGDIIVRGYGEQFFPFVIGHGSLELNAIALAGAAGLMLGRSLLAPGRYTRTAALVRAGRQAVPWVWGLSAMLVGAAAVEAFWSPSVHVPAIVKYVLGTAGWCAVFAWLLKAGTRRAG